METESLPPVAIKLPNCTCAYCGAPVTEGGSDSDHLVGRNFVPKGFLNQSWNLHVRACKTCNNRKSDLEDDLSAITMQPDAFGRLAREDAQLERDARRKGAGSFSRRTGRPVAKSYETFKIQGSPMPGVTMEFTFEAPPQPDWRRAAELARLHLCGLFYWLTFDWAQQRGHFWPNACHLLQFARRDDWGNDEAIGFANLVGGWNEQLVISAARGFFKAAIRRHPAERDFFSWALEWNESLRGIGFIGSEELVSKTVQQIPALRGHLVNAGDGRRLRTRPSVALSTELDRLFS